MYGEGRGFRNGVESAGFGVSAFGVRACLGQVAIWVHGLRVRGFLTNDSPPYALQMKGRRGLFNMALFVRLLIERNIEQLLK